MLEHGELMKTREFSILVIIAVAIVVTMGIAAKLITKKDDTPIEELAEELIYQELGVNIDLTPGSKEEKQEDASK